MTGPPQSPPQLPRPPRSRNRWTAPIEEQGSVSIEFAIVMSALIVGFFTLMIMAGRIMQQESDVRSAAHAAARAASLRDDYAAAQDDAVEVANRNLAESGVVCERQSTRIISPEAEFVPAGVVTVRVECTARAVGSLGLPDNYFYYDATEVIDDYRAES